MLVRQHAREIGLPSGEFTESAPGVAAEGEAPSAAQGPDLDAAQKVKGERLYAQEYEGRFLDLAFSMFSEDDIKAAMDNDLEPLRLFGTRIGET